MSHDSQDIAADGFSTPTAPSPGGGNGDQELDALLAKINNLATQLDGADSPGVATETSPPRPTAAPSAAAPSKSAASTATPRSNSAASDSKPCEAFAPQEPTDWHEAGITPSSVEELVLKYLYAQGEDAGQAIAAQVRMPFTMVSELMQRMKHDRLLHYRGMTSINDYVCELTDLGRERARRLSMQCTYFGSAPVPLSEYTECVGLQSLQKQSPGIDDLKRAFADLLINANMLTRLGAAVNSGRGMFLYGYPGNGKTSIAERVTKAFGEAIWIPRSVVTDGEIIRVFDPSQHEEMPLDDSGDLISHMKIDTRWVRVRRPTIVVGGELTMENLELSSNPTTGINEAPIQMKSNCGTLVIDDFGRQRMTTDELLNRWIVPLEKRYDFLNLPSGKKIQVPFDQLVVFSTNLEPKDLVDDAFLRRIPYKIEVENPSEQEFRQLFKIMCPKMGFSYSDAAIDYLVQKHYRPNDRPFRCCHPRDLLLQVRNYIKFTKAANELTRQNVDFAVSNYFAVM